MMHRVPGPLKGLLDLMIDRELEPYVRLQSKVFLMLGKMEPNVHRQMLLNLGRGWCSSLSGRAFKTYCMLAAHFEFPVFALGRGTRMVVSCPWSTTDEVNEFVGKYEALWNLGKTPDDKHWRNRYFNTQVRKGPADGWTMIEMNRPTNVSVQGLMHTGGWNSIYDVVPKERVLEALSAVQRKEILEVDITSD